LHKGGGLGDDAALGGENGRELLNIDGLMFITPHLKQDHCILTLALAYESNIMELIPSQSL